MIYQLENPQDVANAIYQISLDATVGQLNVSDFQWFITTISEAIDKNLKVELRYDTDTGLDVHHVTIVSATLTYNSGDPSTSSLTINFKNNTTNSLEVKTFDFNAELVEENKNSKPGSFMKYYIKSDANVVIVGIIVSYI